MAYPVNSTPVSEILKDPALRAIFRRAERDNGAAFAVPTPKTPRLDGGATVKPELSLVLA